MRFSRSAFVNLGFSMIGFGTFIGLVFPFAVVPLGVPAVTAFSPLFFGFTIVAGLVVGAANILFARLLVRPRLRHMAQRMQQVEVGIRDATYTGDWSKCDPDECAIGIDSDDEFGVAASAFNRLLVALSQSHEVETRISAFTGAMSAELDVSATCDAAIDYFRSDLGAAAVAILGDSGSGLEVLANHGIAESERLADTDIVRRAVSSLSVESMRVPEHLFIDAGLAMVRPEQVDVYPLVVHGSAIGAVVLATIERVPAAAHALGPLFIRTLAVALSNALSHESIRRIAAQDPLLGILNRRTGLTRLRELFLRHQVGERPLGVVMIDIDHFKTINDTYGHLAGDMVLKALVSTAQDSLRSDDQLIRYGGEELLVVLPGTDADAAEVIAERLRSAVASRRFRFEGHEISITISAGFASTSPQGPRDEMALVAMADEALYAAKRAGRNQVVRAA